MAQTSVAIPARCRVAGVYRRGCAQMCAVLTWGLLVGVCGARGEVYGAHDCCSKAGGARSLLCGVALVLALGGFVAVVFAIYFVAGVAAQRVVCDPLM